MEYSSHLDAETYDLLAPTFARWAAQLARRHTLNGQVRAPQASDSTPATSQADDVWAMIDADDIYHDMMLAVLQDGQQVLQEAYYNGEFRPSYVASWAALKALNSIRKEGRWQARQGARVVEDLDDLEDDQGRGPWINPAGSPRRSWQILRDTAARVLGVDGLDIDRALATLEWFNVKWYQAIVAVLHGFSEREIERAGLARRQVRYARAAFVALARTGTLPDDLPGAKRFQLVQQVMATN